MLHFLGKGNVDFFSWNPLFAEDDPRRKQMIRWTRIVLPLYAALIVLFSTWGWTRMCRTGAWAATR